MRETLYPPIFVGGLMKSGTSLLRKLLSRHPEIYGGLETHWFSEDFASGFRDGSSKRQRWLIEFFDFKEADVSGLRAVTADSDDFFDRFMGLAAQRHGCSRWVEKTPDNILHAGRVYARWPDALLVCMVRDPRDIYASWKRNQKLSLAVFLEQLGTVIELSLIHI